MQSVVTPVPRLGPAPRRAPSHRAVKRRLQFDRIWLTPGYRFGIKVALPAVLLGVGAWAALDIDALKARVAVQAEAVQNTVLMHPDFVLSGIDIYGADPVLEARIRDTLAMPLPSSVWLEDLHAKRAELEALAAIEAAQLIRHDGGRLQIHVTPTAPSAVLRDSQGLWLLDADGGQIRRISDRHSYAELPYIAGDGAGADWPEAERLLTQARALGVPVLGAERIGARRWNLILPDGARVLLPQDAPSAALNAAIAQQTSLGVLGWDISQLDLRLPARPTIRLRDGALARVNHDRSIRTSGGIHAE